MKTLPPIACVLFANTLLQAQIFHYEATLGPEVTNATGTGRATIAYDQGNHSYQLDITFSGLSGVTTVAHIHGPTSTAQTGTAVVMTRTPTFPSFPAGVNAGTYNNSFDLTQTSAFSTAFITANGATAAGAEAAFFSALSDGKAYLNVHSQAYPGGEIRGFFTSYTPVPEPTTTGAIGALLLGSFACVNRLRRSKVR